MPIAERDAAHGHDPDPAGLAGDEDHGAASGDGAQVEIEATAVIPEDA